jgi:hypothetical protein
MNRICQKNFDKSSKKINFDSSITILNNNEINLENILENENYLNDLRTNPNSPLKTLFTTNNIKILIRCCINFDQNNNKESNIDSKIINNLCQVLCSPCVLFFKKSIHNIKYSNNLFNRYKYIAKIEQNNTEEKEEENVENECNNLEIITFKKIKFFNNIFFSPFFCLNENISKNKDSIVKLNKIQDSYEIEHINKRDTYEYDEEEINIINEILDAIFDSSNIKKYEKEKSCLLCFQKIVNFLLYFESDTIINYLIKDTSSEIIDFLLNNLNRVEILNILENILNILSDNADKEKVNNKIYHLAYIKIIKNLVNILIKDNQNNKFDKVDYICELIKNTIINNSEKQLIELFFINNSLMENIKNLIKDIVNKNRINQICIDRERALVSILKVLCQLNNVIITSFNESNFYKSNKKDIDLTHIICNEINIFEYKFSSKKIISYLNIFKAYEDNSDSYLSNLYDIFILISKDIKELYKLNMNNKNKDNQKIGLNNLIKWKFIVSCLQIYIYSSYAIKEFKFNKVQFFPEQHLMEISIQYYLNFPQNNLYLNIFLEIIQLICCEKCPEFLIIPFLKKSGEKEQNEFILQLKNSLEIYLEKKRSDLVSAIFEILKAFYTSSNKTILNFFNKSDLDKTYKNIFIKHVLPKLERHLNEEFEYSNSEIFNSDNDEEDTFDGNDSECFREYESFNTLIENFIRKCNLLK